MLHITSAEELLGIGHGVEFSYRGRVWTTATGCVSGYESHAVFPVFNDRGNLTTIKIAWER